MPVLAAAVSLMAARGEDVPRSLVMMGGPIDTRESPTAVNSLAMQEAAVVVRAGTSSTWCRRITRAGTSRVPGLPQHMGFIGMNSNGISCRTGTTTGTWSGATRRRRRAPPLLRRNNAVLDMPAEYYLDTVRVVFQEHLLPRGLWDVAGERVDPSKIKTAR